MRAMPSQWSRLCPSCDDVDLEGMLPGPGSSTRKESREFMAWSDLDGYHPASLTADHDRVDANKVVAVQAMKVRWQYLHGALVLLLLAVGVLWLSKAKAPLATSDLGHHDPVDFYLPNRGHKDSHGEWRADTWDHFQIPNCDSGPGPTEKEQVHWVEKVKTWVKDTKGVWVDGKWTADPNEPGGGHWVEGHMEFQGHFEWLPTNMSKWVPKKRTAEQLDCVQKQNDANGYHQQLIAQHQSFLQKRKDMEGLLRWQGEHDCKQQLMDTVFEAANEQLAVEGAASGALCQQICTWKGFDGFSWSLQDGCMLKSLGQKPNFQAVPKEGSYSGYKCAQQATYFPWITEEAQKHSLYDGVSSTPAPSWGAPQSSFCFMLVQPYSDDLKLVAAQHSLGKGIFSCDHSAIYSSQLLEFPNGLKTRKIYSSQMVEKGGQWNVDLNTDVSLAVLREVLKDPEWRQAKWIIRADPQCVFSSMSLRDLLARQEGTFDPSSTPALLVSSTVGFPAYFQVMSQSALKSLAEKSRECFWQMRYWGDTQYHDSMWIDTCLTKTVQARRVEVSDLVDATKKSTEGCDTERSIVQWPVATVPEQRTCYTRGLPQAMTRK